jgi:hypothetical protein
MQDVATFCQPEQMIWVEKDIEVSGNPDNTPDSNPTNDMAKISIIDQVFTQIPEPSTMFLSAMGIMAFVAVRRRK